MQIWDGGEGDLGYARVSSDEQARGHSIDNQIARLRANGCTHIWEDTESAYKKGVVRLDFEAMIAHIQTGAARGKRLCVTDFDRLARNELRSFWVFELLEEHNIKLVSLDQPYIDLSDPDGRFMAGQQVIQARAYSARLSRRVKQGHQHHRDRNAAYYPPFAYKKVEERFELDHAPFLCLLSGKTEMSRAEIGRDIVEIFLKSRSLRKSLRTINDKYGLRSFAGKGKGNKQARGRFHFHPSSFTSWMNNPILRGHIAYGRSGQQRQPHKHLWDVRYNIHPDHRLISDEEYKQIEEILDWNAQHRGFQFKADTIHPLSGLIYCGECSGRCRIINFKSRTIPDQRTYSYQCDTYHMKACSQKTSVRESLLEAALIEALTQRAEEIATLAKLPPSTLLSPELQALRSELAFYEAAPGNRAAAIIEDLKRQIEEVRHQSNQHSQVDQANRELLLRCFSDCLYWKTLLDEEKRNLYRALVDRVVMRDGQVESVSLKI